MSNMLRQHIKALKAVEGRSIEAGWFESAKYEKDGRTISVARIARVQEYGFTIDHPGGTKYITDAIVGDRFVGSRFVSNKFQGAHHVTKAHKIVIPARPFMRNAWAIFVARRREIQKKIAKEIITGKITVEVGLERIGLALEGCISKSIVNGNWTPNAASTVRKKGFNRPLVDSSHMLQSINSKVT